MCYEYTADLLVMLLMSVALNIILTIGYVKLVGMYKQADKFMDDTVKLLKKAGKVK